MTEREHLRIPVGRGVHAPPFETLPTRFGGASRTIGIPQRPASDTLSRTDDSAEVDYVTGLAIPGLELPRDFRIGAWIDTGERTLTHLDAHLDKMAAVGLTDACLVINDRPRRGGAFEWTTLTADQVQRLVPSIQQRRVDVTLTCWLTPDRGYIDQMLRELVPLARQLGVRAVEFDAEEPWTDFPVVGFDNHAAAADYVFDRIGLRDAGIAVGITPQVDALKRDSLQRLTYRSDFVVPQAYSGIERVWLSSDENRERFAAHIRSHGIGQPYGPQGLQTRAVNLLRETLRYSGPMPMIMGLKAYAMDVWQGHSPRQIMTLDLARTLELAQEAGINEVRYWSWKWIAGFDGNGGDIANGYSGQFLSDLHS